MNAKNQQPTKDPKDEFVKELISTARKNGLTHLKAIQELVQLGTPITRPGLQQSEILPLIDRAVIEYELILREKQNK